MKELKVQSELAEEKRVAAAQAKKKVDGLQKQAETFRKEADVAQQIAKEKSKGAAKVEKEEQAEETKARHLQAEDKEMQKFLGQTKAEEQSLEAKLVAAKKQRALVAQQVAHERATTAAARRARATA